MSDSLPPVTTLEIRGLVRFTTDLSWHHTSGLEVRSGDVGTVAWRFGDRLAIWVGGSLAHSVPLDCVALVDKPG